MAYRLKPQAAPSFRDSLPLRDHLSAMSPGQALQKATCTISQGRAREMRRFAVAAIILLLTSSFAVAQASETKFQLFAGYSLFHADSGGMNDGTLDTVIGAPSGLALKTFFNGWNGQIQYNLRPSFGIVIDANGRYGAALTATSKSGVTGIPPTTGYTFTIGPVFTFRSKEKVTPFLHVLGGIDRWSLISSTLSSNSTRTTPNVTDTHTAIAIGLGVDYKHSPRLSFRIGQIDYITTGHNLNTVYGDTFGQGSFVGLATRENNFRVSTGIVYHF
jgi:hypothetical protein